MKERGKGYLPSSLLTVQPVPFPGQVTLPRVQRLIRVMEVNLRAVYTMRRCGIGHSGLQRFCGGMNMHPRLLVRIMRNFLIGLVMLLRQ